IDIPVTPVSAVPTAKEAPAVSRRGLFLRRVLFTCIYWSAGLVLGGAAALTLYWQFCRLNLGYAVLSLPLHPVLSQDVARCSEVFVHEGDRVSPGQRLLRLEDDLLTRDLELSQFQCAAAKADFATARLRVEKERDKLNFYKKISHDKLAS